MVSLWPWRGEATAADFEKTLSALSGKIQRASTRSDKFRQSGRKVKVMWTLYTGFAYILTALILILVKGWQTWSPAEYVAVIGSPIVIFGVRKGLTAYYDYRISKTQAYLGSLYKERDDTIDKLKTATKYNSTQQLLEKYGSPKPSPKQQGSPSSKRQPSGEQKKQGPPQPRTGLPPPPTANIVRPPTVGGPQASTPQRTDTSHVTPAGHLPPQQQKQLQGPVAGAEFAPNAFNVAPSTYSAEPHWYDRLFDALLGEDESSAKNRLVLLCQQCRLVNGQAPPGIKSLEELGRWRCGGCGAWNGVESEAKKIVEQIKQQQEKKKSTIEKGEDTETVDVEMEDVSENGNSGDSSIELIDKAEETPPAKSTRSKTKQRKKYEWNKDML